MAKKNLAEKQPEIKKEPLVITGGLVKITATGKSLFMKSGKDYVVSEKLAQKLIKKGCATIKND